MIACLIRTQRVWIWVGVITLIFTLLSPSLAQSPVPLESQPSEVNFLPPRVHPLPPTLIQLTNDSQGEDYFGEVKPTPLGYLIWSEFPIKVYLETGEPDNRLGGWLQAIHSAMNEWGQYLPLVEVEKGEDADIIWKRERPPFRAQIDREAGRMIIPDARNAETTYQFYLKPNQVIAHRFTILLSPHQSDRHLVGTARHELGHALGIWGHSKDPNDVLYPKQVWDPPPISNRDRATLKKIYQQPTQLGWPISN